MDFQTIYKLLIERLKNIMHVDDTTIQLPLESLRLLISNDYYALWTFFVTVQGLPIMGYCVVEANPSEAATIRVFVDSLSFQHLYVEKKA